ncbi:MAG: hypothetical protein DRG66_00300 [Deltaproteobacteria bacterium]|nr:MAG: hypothetical protein DRG66_00300 [Deltaproteobacteria bacterium]
MAGRPGKNLLSKDKSGLVIHQKQTYIQITLHPWPRPACQMAGRPGIGNLMFGIEFLEKLIALI